MDEREARAVLFSAIEGGHPFWMSEIFSLGALKVIEKLQGGGYEQKKFNRLITKISTITADQVLSRIAAAQAEFLIPGEPLWPIRAGDLAAPPIALIVKGNLEALSMQSLAIVGTRNPTNYGARIAGDFAAGFVDREWGIVSGGAYGIDSFAHKGALMAEGITVAVIASGIDINYPVGNTRLFAEICESGAVLTEVMPGHPPIPARFLTRNRLIAALSVATLVVEAAFRSGSLRTARDAAELLRPVMAIPGAINSPTSEGCHRLIGERAAEIVTSVADAVEFIGANR